MNILQMSLKGDLEFKYKHGKNNFIIFGYLNLKNKNLNMAKEKACKNCKLIYEGENCPSCGKKEVSDSFKGKVEIIDTEKYELAKKLKVHKKGIYAIKL